MWNKTGKLILSDFLLSLLCCWTLLPNTCSSIPLPSQSQSNPSAVSFTTNQWQSLMRDAIQFLQKYQKNQQRQEQQQEVLDHKPSIRWILQFLFHIYIFLLIMNWLQYELTNIVIICIHFMGENEKESDAYWKAHVYTFLCTLYRRYRYKKKCGVLITISPQTKFWLYWSTFS